MDHERLRHLARAALRTLIGTLFASVAYALPPESNDNWIELGTWYNTNDSFKFGDYTGLENQGWSALANFDVARRPVWDSNDTRWWRFQGQNLGLASRYARGDFGMQGAFHLWLQYEEIPKFLSDSTEMVFNGRGTDFLTLRPSWIPSDTTVGFAALGASERNIDLSLLRRYLKAGFDVDLPASMQWLANYEYQSKQGRQLIGAVIGNTGGNPRSSIVPQPIDYQTNNVGSTLRWNGKQAQLELGYQYSGFNDSNNSLTWQDPFSRVSGWDAGGYPSGFGRLGMPPDNTFNQVSVSGGADLPFQTRISADTAFGFMRQNANFLPYTVDPALSAPIPLPRDDAGAGINTISSLVRVASRPIDHLRLDATIHYDDRNNVTPRELYQYVAGDSLNQQPINSSYARLNLPNSYRLVEGHLEAGYEIFEGTELSAGYKRQEIERTFTEVDKTSEDTFEGALRSRPLEWLQCRVQGSYADRTGTNYQYASPLFEGFTPAYISTLAPNVLFDNNPLLRKFNLADRQRSLILGRIDITPIERLSIGFDAGWTNDDYNNSVLGLTSRQAKSLSADTTWTPLEYFTTYAWFTYEDLTSHLQGRSFSGGAGQAADPNRNWVEHDQDHVYTAGVGAELDLLNDRLKLRTDYAYSRANTAYDVTTGPALTPGGSFPYVTSRLNDVTVSAEYQIRQNISVRLSYSLEDLRVENWAYGVAPNAMNQVLGLGEKNPDYTDNLVGLSVRYQFP